jgi:hypothetical protein
VFLLLCGADNKKPPHGNKVSMGRLVTNRGTTQIAPRTFQYG